jgi:hypothetical protein
MSKESATGGPMVHSQGQKTVSPARAGAYYGNPLHHATKAFKYVT